MKNLAEKHLAEVTSKLEDYYGVNIIDWIEIIDFYINYYNQTEHLKRELYCAADDYKKNRPGCGIDNLLQTIDGFDIEERTCTAVNNDMFDLSQLKSYIANIGVSFAMNEPERQRKSEEFRRQHTHFHNENLHNEN